MEQSPPADLKAAPSPLRWGRLIAIALAPLLACLLCAGAARGLTPGLAASFVHLQDRWLLLAQAGVALVAVAAWALPPAFAAHLRLPRVPSWAVAATALAVVAGCYAGHYALLAGYDLSRDEQMAVFDTRIYASGRLAFPLPPGWRADAAALNLLFMLPVAHPVAWVSVYLPGNSLLRAGVGLLGDPALTGPLASGAALIFLWGAARRLWPATHAPALVAAAMLLASGQFWLMGMTAYSMPLHLAFNMAWLWLFLGGRRRDDWAALAVGFVATGLHQPLFHPMFVAPWLVLLAERREWRRLALFVVAYGLIGLFWLAWPHLTVGMITGPGSVSSGPGADYWSRLTDALGQNGQNLQLMGANLLRFMVWQPTALLALALVGVAASRGDPRAAALGRGVALLVVVMALILPYQGHGFGYRYMHGLLGNVALLGGYGWQALAGWRNRLNRALAAALAGAVLVLLPLQAAFAHRLFAPFAAASARIGTSGADYAVIGADDGPYALDLVLNRPDLSNRPIRLSAGDIEDMDALAARICRRTGRDPVSVALPSDSFFEPMARYFEVKVSGQAGDRLRLQSAALVGAGCAVSVLR